MEVAASGPLDHLSFVGRGLVPDQVETDATLAADALCVARLPVLVAGPFLDQPLQQVVADPAVPLRGVNAGLLHRLADDLGEGPVNGGPEVRVHARALPPADRGQDAGPLGLARRGVAVPQADAVGGRVS